MTKNKLIYRMYHLTMYNISPIQQGIQSYHAGIEYALKYFKNADFQQWAKKDKTVIILNGGTSSTMKQHLESLKALGVKFAEFREPDLNDSVSGISFLLDERIFDREKYKEEDEWTIDADLDGKLKRSWDDYDVEQAYIKFMGGEKNIEIRKWLQQFRLA